MTTCEPVTEDLDKLPLSELVKIACNSSRHAASFENTQKSSRAVSKIAQGVWDKAAKAIALAQVLKRTDLFEIEEAAFTELLDIVYVVSLVETAAYFYEQWTSDGGSAYPAWMSDIVGKLTASGIVVNQQLFVDHGFSQVDAEDFMKTVALFRKS